MKTTNLLSKLPKQLESTAAGNMLSAINRSNSTSYRAYFTARDIAYFRETQKGKKGDGEAAHELKDTEDSVSEQFEIPTVFSQTDTARARLNAIFVSNTPIFKTVTPPELTAIGEQYDAVIEGDSDRFGWPLQLSMNHLDALKYDITCAEVEWKTLYTAKVTRDEETGRVGMNRQAVYSGNRIKRIHPANAFWDTNVPLHEVTQRGDYAGYVEPVTLPKLLDILYELEYTADEIHELIYPTVAQKQSKNFIDVKASRVPLYQHPRVAKETPKVTPEQSATYFDIPDTEISDKLSEQKEAVNAPYEITTLYIRTIPIVLGLQQDRDDAIMPRLYKVLLLNGCKFLSIEETNYNHNMLPMVFASAMQDGVGLTSKSFSHNLESLQVLANKLITADIRSSMRAIADRAIYNPHMIDPRHANNPSSTAKIPLKTSSPTTDVRAAYLAVPHVDSALGARFQQAISLLGFGNEISGSNPIVQGQFVKGNKTNQQFQESMSASDTRLIAMALGLHVSFYTQIQEIIKHNVQQFQTSEDSYSSSMERTVKINAGDLQRMLPTFRMANGLLQASRIVNTEALTVALQSIPNIPELSQEYNVAKMFIDLVSNGEGLKLEKFRYSPEEKQARQEQQMAMMQAQAEAENPQQQAPQQQAGLLQRMFGRG